MDKQITKIISMFNRYKEKTETKLANLCKNVKMTPPLTQEDEKLSETESEANEREEAAAVAELRKQFPDQWTPALTAEEQAASVRIAKECANRMAGSEIDQV